MSEAKNKKLRFVSRELYDSKAITDIYHKDQIVGFIRAHFANKISDRIHKPAIYQYTVDIDGAGSVGGICVRGMFCQFHGTPESKWQNGTTGVYMVKIDQTDAPLYAAKRAKWIAAELFEKAQNQRLRGAIQ